MVSVGILVLVVGVVSLATQDIQEHQVGVVYQDILDTLVSAVGAAYLDIAATLARVE